MQSDPELRSLVERAQAGDRKAAEDLLLRHRERLASVVFFRLGALVRAKVEVEDILQETFLRAMASLGRFEWKGEGSFFPWLRSIAEHAILEIANREKRRGTEALPPEAPDGRTAQSRVLMREERFERLRAALDGLSEDHRKVILLARIQRLPIQEIALRMRRSPDAVTNLLARALAKLKESFGDTESFHLPDRRLLGP